MIIHQIKNIFPNVSVARYNLAVWQNQNDNSLFFIGREVEKAGREGQPDIGLLKLFEVDADGKIIQEKILWKPNYDSFSLEDPRALELENENLIIGLTAVLRTKKGKPIPFPAIVKINSLLAWQKVLPPILIIDSFGPGKNLTPIDQHTYIFRPDDPEYNHKLLVFTLHSQFPEKIAEITFPKNLDWANWRIGTTMPPIWLTPTEAIFIVHGISKQVIDGKEKYVYSIGRAKLTRKENRFKVVVAPEPILTPDDFLDKNGLPLVEELHPKLRRVVYSCGGVIKKQKQDVLSLYVNVGDRATFEVELILEQLKTGLF